MDKEKQLAELARCVLEMEDEAVVEVAKDYIDAGYDAYSGIVNGLSKGMEEAGHRFEEESYFVPELLICSDAMYNGLDVLKPHLLSDKTISISAPQLWALSKAIHMILVRIL